MFTIRPDILGLIDLQPLERFATNLSELHQGGYYRLLVALSEQVSGCLLIDAGTWNGTSAACMGFNGRNRVLSYDTKDFGARARLAEMDNVECRCENILLVDWAIIYPSALIFLDVDPHDGEQEQVFISKLIDLHYQGVVVCDDIHLNPGMREFWQWTESKVPWRYDVTKYGHETGTGILSFDAPLIVDDYDYDSDPHYGDDNTTEEV